MLLTLIDDILDFSKIEMGKLELEKIPFDMQLLLIDLKDTFIIQAEAKGLELILAQTQYLPRFIKGDPTRLRQVFSNLIANAIKFTDEGKVSIDVKASEIEGEYEVIVQDTGIGIGSDVQKRLFTAFTQANSSITREYGGTGLGLAISAMLVQLMGGRIWLESELGKGSKFHFTFKAESVTDEFVLARPETEPVTDLGHLKVLLAEDHQINRLLVSKMLNRVNIKPDLACDGLEALAYVQEKDYDVVLMDLQMPNIDGITATKKIRSNSKIHQPYIIALTANVFAENKAECYAVGMNDFISKPVSMESLVNALDKR
jgi:CheY-like chemotaxis protein